LLAAIQKFSRRSEQPGAIRSLIPRGSEMPTKGAGCMSNIDTIREIEIISRIAIDFRWTLSFYTEIEQATSGKSLPPGGKLLPLNRCTAIDLQLSICNYRFSTTETTINRGALTSAVAALRRARRRNR
jgi:hypothetical protein